MIAILKSCYCSRTLTYSLSAILHTIFFHRLFTPLQPSTHETLDLTLPQILDPEIASLIDTKTTALLRHLDSTYSAQRANLTLSFLEKKRRKGWFAAANEETTWESWVIRVEILSARTEGERSRLRKGMERTLGKAVLKVVETVNRERNHIPPITTNETNPFPFQIVVGGKG